MNALSVTSTKARVNVEKARQVLQKYATNGFKFMLDEQGYLEAVEAEPEKSVNDWPLAVTVDDVPKMYQFSGPSDYCVALDELYLYKGRDGFTALLQELASCLETPMMILALRG